MNWFDRFGRRHPVLFHALIFLVGLLLTGLVIDFAVGLSARDYGILGAVVFTVLVLGLAEVYRHNRRTGKIPYSRAGTIVLLFAPLFYMAALLLLFPLIMSPDVTQGERDMILAGFFGLSLVAVPLAFIRNRKRMRRFREELSSRAKIR